MPTSVSAGVLPGNIVDGVRADSPRFGTEGAPVDQRHYGVVAGRGLGDDHSAVGVPDGEDRTPDVVIPYGTAKAPAVRAALRSGLVGGIVTHTALAHAVLQE